MTLIEAHTALYRIAIEQPGELARFDWVRADPTDSTILDGILGLIVVHGWLLCIHSDADLLDAVGKA